MMRALFFWFALALSATTFSGCATVVVSADPHVGYEGKGEHRLRLYMDRVRLDPVEDIRTSVPQVCFECGEDGDLSNATTFTLPFFATNDGNQPWLLTGEMFHLERLDKDPGALPKTKEIRHETVIANIAPHSTSRFSVLVSLVGSEGVTKISNLNATYRLTVRDDGGAMLLDRNLSIGYFSQPLQLLRFLGFFAGGLLVLGAL